MSVVAGGEASSIEKFCDAHDLSRSSYFNLRKKGLGPREMRVGGRVLISREAAADWRRAMEERATNQASAKEVA